MVWLYYSKNTPVNFIGDEKQSIFLEEISGIIGRIC
jgi:hypothetical protein